jgi:predicted TIM-barrel fold metal-dependent hydrolase
MPYGGTAWLAQTQEEILEPDIPICDAHHHLWDFHTEFIPYERYLLHEFAADVHSGHNVRSTVFLQARAMYRKDGPPELRSVGEVEFAQGVAAASASGLYGPCRVAAAIVGWADLKQGDRARPVLEALREASPNRFRGVRDFVYWEPGAVSWSGAPLPPEKRELGGVLGSADFRAACGHLAQMALSLDLHASISQLREVADLARANPDLIIVVNHLGGFGRGIGHDRQDEDMLRVWREGIALAAEQPNVHMKLDGVGMPKMGFGWEDRRRPVGSEELAATLAPLLSYCIEKFSAERCMFASNFPPDKISFSYPVVFNAFKRFSKAYSAAERAAMFHDTAAKVYRISDV